VHLEPARARARDDARQRIEVRALAAQQLAPGDQAAPIERVPPAADLDEDRVEPAAGRLVHDLVHGGRRDQARAYDPRPAQLGSGGAGGGNGPGEGEEGEEDDHPIQGWYHASITDSASP